MLIAVLYHLKENKLDSLLDINLSDILYLKTIPQMFSSLSTTFNTLLFQMILEVVAFVEFYLSEVLAKFLFPRFLTAETQAWFEEIFLK